MGIRTSRPFSISLNRGFRFGCIQAGALFLCLAAALGQAGADDAAVFAAAKATLKEWRQSIVSVHLQYEAEVHEENAPPGETASRLEDFAWTESGKRRHYLVFYKNGLVNYRSLYICDGNKTTRASWPWGESEEGFPERVIIVPEFKWRSGITPLHGLFHEGTDQWLGDVLDRPAASIVGSRTMEGKSFAEIRIQFDKFFMSLELDSQHGYLPRRAWSSTGTFDMRVSEFKQVEGLWFPARSRFTIRSREGNSDSDFTLKSARVNEPLPDGLFAVAVPPGTFVTDMFTGKSTVQRGPGMQERLQARLVAHAKNAPTTIASENPEGAPSSAIPAGDWSPVWMVALAAVSFLLLVAAVWLRHQR